MAKKIIPTIWLMRDINEPIQEITAPGGLTTLLRETRERWPTAHLWENKTDHIEWLPRNANCFVRRHLKESK